MDLDQLQNIIKGIDQEMIRVRERFRTACQHRNKSGLQLVNRNDEISVLHEKRSILEEILKEGEKQMQLQDDEIRKLTTHKEDLQSKLNILRKKAPSMQDQKDVERNFYCLKAEIAEQKELVNKLSYQLEIPAPELNEKRYRNVKGSDPSELELESKLAVLQVRVNKQHEKMLEKEMILDEVSSMVSKIRSDANEGKENSLQLAQKINEVQNKIKKLTRKLMANVSEFAMYQALSLQLEEEMEVKMSEFEEGKALLERNLPPSERATHQWLRIQRDRINREETILHPRTLDVQSRATIRPTAYIDQRDGIPKPYGGHAPFKPSEDGSSMRHIKKLAGRMFLTEES